MTFTATGEPSNIPPRVKLDVATGVSGATFNSLSITQDGVPIRLQPPTGTESTSTYDYEMPFGQSVTYVASGDYLPFVAPDFTEIWASLASWTVDAAGWALGAGDTITSTTFGATVRRTASATIQRVEVTDPDNVFVLLLSADDAHNIAVGTSNGSTAMSSDSGSSIVAGVGSYTITLIDGVVTASAADSSWSLTGAYSGDLVKVYMYSAGGQFVDTGTSFAASGDPDRIVVASGGNIYTLDIAAKVVRKFNSSGAFQTSWSTTNTPNDIALDSSENVYVTDRTSNLVRKYTSSGTPSTTWSTTGEPSGIAVDSANAVYVYDWSADTIRKYTNTGGVTTSWANGASAENELHKAIDVLPGGTTVYTWADDEDNDGDVYVYNSTGTELLHFPNTSGENTNITVDSAGNFWVGHKKYSGTTGLEISSLSISPHTGSFVRATATPSTVLVSDTTDDTVRTFSTTTATVGVIEVTPAAAPVTFYEVASVTLTITEAWLIHPAQPTLSVSIDSGTWRDSGLNVDPASSQQNTAESAVTLHSPIGRTRTVAIAHGNRLEETWPLVLLAPTIAARDTVRAIVRDQTPLLLRSPTSFGWDLTDGYYSVQTVQSDRLTANLKDTYRRITLPLIPSDPPVVRIATSRTYDDVLQQNDTYTSVLLRYESYNDLLLGIS